MNKNPIDVSSMLNDPMKNIRTGLEPEDRPASLNPVRLSSLDFSQPFRHVKLTLFLV